MPENKVVSTFRLPAVIQKPVDDPPTSYGWKKQWAKPGDPLTSDKFNDMLNTLAETHGDVDEKLEQFRQENRGLLETSIEVLSKRLKESEERNSELEQLVSARDKRIEALVDIIINKLGGEVG